MKANSTLILLVFLFAINITYSQDTLFQYKTGEKRCQGKFILGKREGAWTYWHKSGQLKAKGDFKNNQRIGMWLFWCDNPDIYAKSPKTLEFDTYYENGKINSGSVPGYSKCSAFSEFDDFNIYDLNADSFQEILYKISSEKANQKTNFKKESSLKDSLRYFLNSKDPIILKRFNDAHIMIADISLKNREGYINFYYDNGNKESEYKLSKNTTGEPVMEAQMYYETGNIRVKEALIVNNKRNGPKITYYDNGDSSEIRNYKNGLESGVYKKFGNHNMVIDEYYKVNNNIEGLRKVYSTSGKKGWQAYYTAGKENGEYIKWNSIGNIDETGNYAAGKKTGVWIAYYGKPENAIMWKMAYNNGERDGETILYYLNGKIKKTEHYNNGLQNGIFNTYTEEGTLISSETYEDGILIKPKK